MGKREREIDGIFNSTFHYKAQDSSKLQDAAVCEYLTTLTDSSRRWEVIKIL